MKIFKHTKSWTAQVYISYEPKSMAETLLELADEATDKGPKDLSKNHDKYFVESSIK